MVDGPLLLAHGDPRLRIDPTAWLAPSTTVVGQVRVDAHASVFYGGSSAPTWPPSTSENAATCRTTWSCTAAPVEDRCLIGMNATVLDGAVVGAGSLVAAGTVVREGAVIPPRSLPAGVPGKVLRELTDEEYQRVVGGADVYVDLAAGHRRAEKVNVATDVYDNGT
jgi:carbonic anhydrase/acetyltransferase-like protein (isoleucine patch superfamily)